MCKPDTKEKLYKMRIKTFCLLLFKTWKKWQKITVKNVKNCIKIGDYAILKVTGKIGIEKWKRERAKENERACEHDKRRWARERD